MPFERMAMFSRNVPMGKVAIVFEGTREVVPGLWMPPWESVVEDMLI